MGVQEYIDMDHAEPIPAASQSAPVACVTCSIVRKLFIKPLPSPFHSMAYKVRKVTRLLVIHLPLKAILDVTNIFLNVDQGIVVPILKSKKKLVLS